MPAEQNWKALPTGLTYKGAKIELHWTYFFLLILRGALARIAFGWEVCLYELMLCGPILFLIILLHELAKAVVTHRSGGTIDRIVLWPLGGLTVYGGDDIRTDLKVAFAGSFSHVILAIFYGVLFTIFNTEVHVSSLFQTTVYVPEIESGFGVALVTACRTAFWWNLYFIFIHTIVPIHPLNGLRIVAGVLKLSNASMSTTWVARACSICGMVLSAVYFIWGIVRILPFTNFTGGIFEIFAGAIGFVNSKLLYDSVKNDNLSQDPVFGRPCFQSDDGDNGNDGNVASVEFTSTSPSPVAATEADII